MRARLLCAELAIALSGGIATTPSVDAATLSVDNCDDDGSGSLRDAVAHATSGDTIDLTALSCSLVSLSSGAIEVTQDSLTLEGLYATIDGGYVDRVFDHTGSGTLKLKALRVEHGKYVSDTTPSGGCIRSFGSVILDGGDVAECRVVGNGASVARGGGIFTEGDLFVSSSRISGNTVQGNGSGIANAIGGGAYVGGSLSAKYAFFDGNSALTIDDHNSSAGAFAVRGSAAVSGSTISRNYAVFFGAASLEGGAGASASIINSTISGNRANTVSGVYTQVPLTIANSTIAFNVARFGRGAVYSQVAAVDLESTIIAGNQGASGAPSDFVGTEDTPLSGANNLVTSSNIPLPPGTITACPHLAPLDDNGDALPTLALRADSPAIDAGNNDAGLDFDQRGLPRVVGAAADIGAFEWTGPDVFAFSSGFEATCDG